MSDLCAAQPPSLLPSNAWRRTTESTSESHVSCCRLVPLLTWMGRRSMRPWQPFSSPRSTIWRWTLVRSSQLGKEQLMTTEQSTFGLASCVFPPIKHHSHCSQHRSGWDTTGGPGHHGDRSHLCWTAYWWHHPHHCSGLVPVSTLLS